MINLYTYNKKTLLFEKFHIPYKAFTVLIFCGIILFTVNVKLYFQIAEKDRIIAEKNKLIEEIKTPLGKSYDYITDLHKTIGFDLTDDEFLRFKGLANKYRGQIESAKVPATLVWYIAYRESRFIHTAKNDKSTAKGLFQFVDNTWNEVCKIKGYSKDSRFDADKQIKVMLDYLNIQYEKHKDWNKVVESYHGGRKLYDIKFLLK